MNLIDVNLLKDHLTSVFRTSKQVGISVDEELIMNTVSNQPVVDAVNVVRCKDCGYFYVSEDNRPMCKRTATKHATGGYYGLVATRPYGFSFAQISTGKEHLYEQDSRSHRRSAACAGRSRRSRSHQDGL